MLADIALNLSKSAKTRCYKLLRVVLPLYPSLHKDNVNPIERVERSTLIMAATLVAPYHAILRYPISCDTFSGRFALPRKCAILSAPKSINRSDVCDLRLRCPSQTPEKSQQLPRQEKAMVHCDVRVRWKVASDLRFRAAISGPKPPVQAHLCDTPCCNILRDTCVKNPCCVF